MVATVVNIPLALAVSWLLVKTRVPGRLIVDVLVSLPLAVPPIAIGFFLLLLLGREGPIGGLAHVLLGADIVFTWFAAAAASAVVSFPLMARATMVAMAGVDERLEMSARSLGAGPWRVFLHDNRAAGLAGHPRGRAARIRPGDKRVRRDDHRCWEHRGQDADPAPSALLSRDPARRHAGASADGHCHRHRGRHAGRPQLAAGEDASPGGRVTVMTAPVAHIAITKRFPQFTLDCDVTFEAGATSVFGPSGSGKTTLLNCIAGLTRPDSGQIAVMGTTIFSTTERRVVPPEKRRFGYVFQSSALFPNMNVRKNILYGYHLTPVEQRTTDPEQLYDLFDLTRLLDRSVDTLSGGERQRVALARALATSPRMLLLDEPLASLDVSFKGAIIRYLNRVRQELQTPMIYVSHSISEVVALAEEMLVLSEGKPVAQGPPSEVLVRPDVGTMADYGSLENLLDATVVERRQEQGLTVIDVGGVELAAPEVDARPGDLLTVSIRAGDIILTLDVPTRISAQNILPGRIKAIHAQGPRVIAHVDVGAVLVVELTPRAVADLALREGTQVYLIVKSNSVLALDALE